MQERVNSFLTGLTNHKDEVRRRCRTVLQSRAEALLSDSQPDDPHHGKCTSHLGFSLEQVPAGYVRALAHGARLEPDDALVDAI